MGNRKHHCYRCDKEQELILVHQTYVDFVNNYDVEYSITIELRCKECNNEWKYTVEHGYVPILDFRF